MTGGGRADSVEIATGNTAETFGVDIYIRTREIYRGIGGAGGVIAAAYGAATPLAWTAHGRDVRSIPCARISPCVRITSVIIGRAGEGAGLVIRGAGVIMGGAGVCAALLIGRTRKTIARCRAGMRVPIKGATALGSIVPDNRGISREPTKRGVVSAPFVGAKAAASVRACGSAAGLANGGGDAGLRGPGATAIVACGAGNTQRVAAPYKARSTGGG